MHLKRNLYTLTILLWSGYLSADATSSYGLPASKTYFPVCRYEALQLHPGVIEKQQVIQHTPTFWVQYLIRGQDTSEWSVLCDLAHGNIIKEQKLIGDEL